MIDRRKFIIRCAQCTSAITASTFLDLGAFIPGGAESAVAGLPRAEDLSHVEARHYRKLDELEVECGICPRKCRVSPLERGYCGTRENENGKYYTLVYSRPCSLNIDPIEKKPLFHFLPGTNAFSMATAGCNVNCKFCQNWNISQVRPEQVENYLLTPDDIARMAVSYDCPTIAYTYSEPVIFYEYMYDCSVKGHDNNVHSVAITGAYIMPEPLKELLDALDGVKVDLKAFSEDFYRDYVRGELQPVLDAIKIIHNQQKWLELVYLVIPTLNDKEDEMKRMCNWISRELSPDVPLHLTRFHPMYLMKNLPSTPRDTLFKLHEIAREAGLNYVYIGNVPGNKYEHTYCPQCGKILIERYGYRLGERNITDSRCKFCDTKIPGVWA
ncbi:MAG: AmmeMemoRadiSam system radical SAM enzyme [candidate division Zixibacteria bacterium]|nr:AmmeMemoRadiSam system radical SAM enzyme [candidate division Zixibacteria bacterium]